VATTFKTISAINTAVIMVTWFLKMRCAHFHSSPISTCATVVLWHCRRYLAWCVLIQYWRTEIIWQQFQAYPLRSARLTRLSIFLQRYWVIFIFCWCICILFVILLVLDSAINCRG
jgi:hypothetical protein